MKVEIPTPLRSYTGAPSVEADASSVDTLLRDLDARFPGFRFRIIDEQDAIRPHIRIFVNGEQVWRLDRPLAPTDRIQILQALSGG